MSGYDYETLLKAVVEGDLDVVKLILSAGADVNIGLGRRLDTLLHLANDVEIIEELLLRGANVNAKNLSGETPLLVAIINGKGLPVVKALLSANADFNRRYYGSTLLHYASDAEVTKELLLYGLDVNVRNSQGETPLHYAVASREGLLRVKELLRHGAEVNASDDYGETALFSALSTIDLKIIDAKVYGFQCNYCNEMEIVKELLEYGADINLKHIRSDGDPYSSPLGVAINTENLPLIKMLIKLTLINRSNEDYNKIVNLDPFVEEDNYTAMTKYFKDCVSEIVKMKNDNFYSNYYSLHDFISVKTDTTIKPLYSNYKIEEYISANYPIYRNIIFPRIKECIERARLFVKIRDFQIFAVSDIDSEEVILIPDCIIKICEYLTKDDLVNFIKALSESN